MQQGNEPKRLTARTSSWCLALLLCLTLTPSALAERVISVKASGERSQAALEAALAEARQIRQRESLHEPLVIQLQEGSWPLDRPLVLGPEDSGDAQSPLIIRGAGMEKTILSGGRRLGTFVAGEDGVWTMDLSPWQPMGEDIPQLWVNGQRAICARTPNESCYPTGSALETLIDSLSDRSPNRNGLAATQVKIPRRAVEDLQHTHLSPRQMRINLLHAWDLTRRTVQSISLQDSLIFFTGNRQPSWNHIDRESQFYLENDRSFLDAPGEFFVDTYANRLYYIPRAGEDPATAEAIVPHTDQLLILSGTVEHPVQHIHLEGLTLAYTRYTFPWRGDDPCQADANQNAAISCQFAQHIHLTDCEVAHTANWAIELGAACRDNVLVHNYLHDLGGGGIKIGTMQLPDDEERLLSRGNRVDNCIITQGGRTFPTAVGVILFHTSDNQVTHNEISDFYYTGVSVGWVWGYSHSPSVRNIINYNHIHHIGQGLLSDMGGVYTLGYAQGTQVCHNRIHDIYSLGYGGWGLYTDEGSMGVLMENNLVYNCKSSGFHQHYGKENVIRNNIFVNNLKAQLEATRPEPEHLPFTFTNNIIVYEQGQMYGIRWNEVNFQSDYNLYWNTRESVSWNGMSLPQWQQSTGKDLHSILADPQFADIASGDFTIRNRRAIRRIHFVPFDYSQAGVYGDSEWVDRAQQRGFLLRVLTTGNAADSLLLRTPCTDYSPQDLQDQAFKQLCLDMVATVTHPTQRGVGIAGPQVGVSRRIVVVKRYDKEGRPFEVYPNIRITATRGDQQSGPEGCLSIPGKRGNVMRYQDIDIQYTSPVTQQVVTERVQGYSAVIFQHECDHLDGVLYTDRMD